MVEGSPRDPTAKLRFWRLGITEIRYEYSNYRDSVYKCVSRTFDKIITIVLLPFLLRFHIIEKYPGL